MAKLHLVALGSSFAAGPGIEPIVNKATMRSGRNYAHQLAEKLDAELTDLTASGATLLNVLDTPQQTVFSNTVLKPQLEDFPANADIVTITAGGNDLGYSGGQTIDSYLSYAGPLKWFISKYRGRPTTDVDVDELSRRFCAVIDRIKIIAPTTKIYLAEYPAVFGDATTPGQDVPLTAEQVSYYRERARVLNAGYATAAAARPGVDLVPVSKASEGHEVGTADTWMLGFGCLMPYYGQVPYHPNLAGHTAVADMLYERIKASRRPV
ncbi:hypothetical protein LTR56_000431 [Elasticomyces elasticus]|nr:hypothetical protein LTR56_000431 [Elasticomyces elasticus]KAK3666874.1 hypothetical protein LTR22_002099 [Elasticomyces elasticus]KAK4933425.1 hypothetical protein LTR49_000419 [Elasticomyces elasticus]KAK5751176.1 hypothetical protein LTS12_018728 [Elasticomyces elasticus]